MNIRTIALAGALGAIIFCCQCATSETAGVRAMAETQLKWCLDRVGDSEIAREACKQESFAYCLEHMPKNHIEKGCGLGAHWRF